MKDSIPQLSPYMEPSPVRFTFDSPGWYAVGVLLILAALSVLFLWVRHYYRNRYRRIAIALLEDNEKQALASEEYGKLVYNANMIAKQICIRLYGRQDTAPLRDSPWVIFLNKTSAPNTFSTADAQIIRAIYDPKIRIEKQQALNFAGKIKYWIRKHHNRV